jgi:hypothetical protein
MRDFIVLPVCEIDWPVVARAAVPVLIKTAKSGLLTGRAA